MLFITLPPYPRPPVQIRICKYFIVLNFATMPRFIGSPMLDNHSQLFIPNWFILISVYLLFYTKKSSWFHTPFSHRNPRFLLYCSPDRLFYCSNVPVPLFLF
jgi:hypothetical protein